MTVWLVKNCEYSGSQQPWTVMPSKKYSAKFGHLDPWLTGHSLECFGRFNPVSVAVIKSRSAKKEMYDN